YNRCRRRAGREDEWTQTRERRRRGDAVIRRVRCGVECAAQIIPRRTVVMPHMQSALILSVVLRWIIRVTAERDEERIAAAACRRIPRYRQRVGGRRAGMRAGNFPIDCK